MGSYQKHGAAILYITERLYIALLTHTPGQTVQLLPPLGEYLPPGHAPEHNSFTDPRLKISSSNNYTKGFTKKASTTLYTSDTKSASCARACTHFCCAADLGRRQTPFNNAIMFNNRTHSAISSYMKAGTSEIKRSGKKTVSVFHLLDTAHHIFRSSNCRSQIFLLSIFCIQVQPIR